MFAGRRWIKVLDGYAHHGRPAAMVAQGDVEKFRSGWDSYRNGILGNTPAEMRGAVQTQLDAVGPANLLGVSKDKMDRDIKTAENAMNTEQTFLMNDLAALARDGGTYTKAFQSKLSQLKTLVQQRVNNPAFALDQRTADMMMKGAEDRLKGEAFKGTADRLLAKGGVNGARQRYPADAGRLPLCEIRERGRMNLTELRDAWIAVENTRTEAFRALCSGTRMRRCGRSLKRRKKQLMMLIRSLYNDSVADECTYLKQALAPGRR